MSTSNRETKTVKVDRSLHQRLTELKPYSSVSYNDLIEEMADVYEEHEA